MILLPLPHSIQGLVGTSYIFVLLTSVANFHEIKCHENAMKSLVLAKKTIKSRSNTIWIPLNPHWIPLTHESHWIHGNSYWPMAQDILNPLKSPLKSIEYLRQDCTYGVPRLRTATPLPSRVARVARVAARAAAPRRRARRWAARREVLGMEGPQNGWFTIENPTQMDDFWGAPVFRKPRIVPFL